MAKRKNVLLLLADEWRADTVGCYGHPLVRTPATDDLAARGVRFANHFTPHGKCVPARVALYSGRYPNLGGHRTLGILLQPHEANLGLTLREAGYHCAILHRNHTIDSSWIDRVFHERIGMDRPYPGWYAAEPGLTEAEVRAYYHGRSAERPPDQDSTDLLCDWLRQRRDGDTPFFANINWDMPHPPYKAVAGHADRYPLDAIELLPTCDAADKPLYVRGIRETCGAAAGALTPDLKRRILQAYYGMVSCIDEQVGRIVATLRECGLWDDTIVILASDHGDYCTQYDLLEKWDTGFEDCIVHVPFILAGGGLSQGRVVQGFTSHVDLFPTLADLLGIECPVGVSGASLVPMIEDPGVTLRDYAFAEGGHEPELLRIPIAPEEHNVMLCYQGKATVRNRWPDSLRRAKMIRTAEFKYIYRVAEADELYDLRTDPHECRNLAADPACADVIREYRDRLLCHLVENEDKRPLDPKPIA